MSASEALDQLCQEIKEDTLRTARFHDRLDRSLAETQQMAAANIRAALPAADIPFAPARRKLTKAWLNELVKPYKQADPSKFKGITAIKRQSIHDYIAWLSKRDIDVMGCWDLCLKFPTPKQLLAYWRSTGSPVLS